MALRVHQGLSTGFCLPSVVQMVGAWSTRADRTTLLALAFLGLSVAGITNFPLSSALCYSGVDGGWPLVFYVPGVACVLWCAAFQAFVADRPEHHKRIGEAELEYLKSGGVAARPKSTPYAKILLSGRLWALHFTILCATYASFSMYISLPSFIDEALKVGILKVTY